MPAILSRMPQSRCLLKDFELIHLGDPSWFVIIADDPWTGWEADCREHCAASIDGWIITSNHRINRERYHSFQLSISACRYITNLRFFQSVGFDIVKTRTVPRVLSVARPRPTRWPMPPVEVWNRDPIPRAHRHRPALALPANRQ